MKIQQSNIFEFIENNNKPLINNNLKLLSLFSGIGAFEKALDRLNIKYELVNYCEIDKYASKSYSLIHNVSENKNLWDITTVDTSKLPNDIDLVTYGFPCQDISLAGNQKGFEHNGERTRSGLFFEALRIIEDTKPKIAIAENVKNLTSKKFKNEFEIVLNSLEETGYNNYWQVLNAKDYGVPQNRERVFIISIRKDVDNGKFKFPEPFPLELKLKDMLEDEVDEKYFLSGKMIKYIVADNEKWTGNNDKAVINKDVASTINTGEGSRRCDASNYICNDLSENYDLKKGLCTINGNKSLMQTLEQNTIVEGEFIDGYNKNVRKDGLSGTITTRVSASNNTYVCVDDKKDSLFTETQAIMITLLRIRKLTPKECWRLMGFEDKEFEKVDGILSNVQLFKQAGNSIVVDVLVEIFKELFKGEN